MYVDWQVAEAPAPDRVHVVNVPVALVDNDTVPVGVVGVAEMSVTVTVQLVELSTTNVVGWQDMVVVVA